MGSWSDKCEDKSLKFPIKRHTGRVDQETKYHHRADTPRQKGNAYPRVKKWKQYSIQFELESKQEQLSETADFKPNPIRRDKNGHYILEKGIIQLQI